MQEKSTSSLRLKTTARQPGRAADGCRTARPGPFLDHDWRRGIVAALVEAQPSSAAVRRGCRSAPRYRQRSWWLDTSPPAQSRRAVKRWHGHAQDLWLRNVQIAAWVALGSAQAHVGAKYGLTRQRVGQIVREFEWVQEAVQERVQSLDDPSGGGGGKCQSSLRGEGGSGSLVLESIGRCSGEFRPLSRPERARWRRVCDRRGAGSRRRPPGCAPPGTLAAVLTASLASSGAFGAPSRGESASFPPLVMRGKVPVGAIPALGENASSDPVPRGGKMPVSRGQGPALTPEDIARRWRLRGGEVWKQRGFAFLRPVRPPTLEETRKYQRQGGLW